MDINDLPPTVYVAIGTLLASLIAGVFSYLNMIASKENKVSEFRLAWINGLREEIAEFCSGVQNLSLFLTHYYDIDFYEKEDENLKWISEIAVYRGEALKSLTKIRLRLNHKEIISGKNSPERNLITAIDIAREDLNNENFEGMNDSVSNIRSAASEILKSSWETVKKGERSYIIVKRGVEIILMLVLILMLFGASYQYKNAIEKEKYQKERFDNVLDVLKRNGLEMDKIDKN